VSNPLKHVFLASKTGSREGPQLVDKIGSWLEERGVAVTVDLKTARALGRTDGVHRRSLPADADLAIVAGGDGSLLSMARHAGPRGIPMLGVNLGSLGFLTELQPEEAFSGLEQVLEGRYTVEERLSLKVAHLRKASPRQTHTVLNDAVITKSALARMIQIRVEVDDLHVATYTSDGLIVSTPTGSTAYSLSAGGPILDPRVEGFVIAPICPHTMTYRPLVVPSNVRIRVELSTAGEAVYLTLDGQIGFPLETDDALEIRGNDTPVRLVRVADRGFFEVLQRKLRWGAR
jgi:NAD+ kinase